RGFHVTGVQTCALPISRAISHVRNQAGFQLVFHYRLDGGRAYVVHVDTPVGRFHYDYTDGKPSTGPLLASVRRPDGMQRRYLYEIGRAACRAGGERPAA